MRPVGWFMLLWLYKDLTFINDPDGRKLPGNECSLHVLHVSRWILFVVALHLIHDTGAVARIASANLRRGSFEQPLPSHFRPATCNIDPTQLAYRPTGRFSNKIRVGQRIMGAPGSNSQG